MATSSEEEGGFFVTDSSIPNKEPTKTEEQFVVLPLSQNDVCMYCQAILIDMEIKNSFKKLVCKTCKFEKMKFITKTTCYENYLLNNEDLKDLMFLKRKNPHKSNWSDMSLFLEQDVVDLAIKKYGDLKNIEKIKDERATQLMERKRKKIRKKVKEYRQKTFIQKKTDKKHIHVFKIDGKIKQCDCGLKYEEEDI